MDIIIKEIEISDDEKVIEFNRICSEVEKYLETRYLNLENNSIKKNKMKMNLEMNTNTEVSVDLIKMTYIKLFGVPKNNKYDSRKLEVIKKHLKLKNLI